MAKVTGYQGLRWPLSEDIDRKQSQHHEALFDLLGCYNGSGILREEFATQIEKIRTNPNLTAVGQRAEIAKLIPELRTEERFLRFQRIIKREEERAKAIKARLTKTPEPSNKPMSAAEMREELKRDRLIRDFKVHPTEERQRIIRTAMDVGDLDFLNVVTSELGLVAPEIGRRIDAMRMRAVDPDSLSELNDLLGPVDYRGEHQAERGALVVARQRLVELEKWLTAQAEGAYRPSLAELLEQRGLPAAIVSAEAIMLSREMAKHADIFRTAKAEAEAAGIELHVESPEGNGSA